jgi:hypothetical protein
MKGPRNRPQIAQERSEGGPEGDRLRAADALHLACDALVSRTRVQTEIDGEWVWQKLPSLLEQLAGEDARHDGLRSSYTGSRPPINTGIVALLTDIGDTSRRQLKDLGSADHGADMVRNVRAATTATIVTSDDDEMSIWLYVLVRWRHRARQELQLDSSRRQWLRGIACPQCGSTVALGKSPNGGERMQTPALAVTWAEPADGRAHVEHEWRWEAIDCRACGASWWRGENLHHLLAALQSSGAIAAWSNIVASS